LFTSIRSQKIPSPNAKIFFSSLGLNPVVIIGGQVCEKDLLNIENNKMEGMQPLTELNHTYDKAFF